MPNFVTRLKNAMISAGVNQRELAAKIGVTEATMSRWANGTREPKASKIAEISSVLGVSCDWLLLGK